MNCRSDNATRVVAIVVTYNRKALLLECIEALLSQTLSNRLDILIIDNASTDGTSDAVDRVINSNHSNVFYINTGENLGGAGGFSFGMKEAVKRGYGWAWVMDDDCIPKNDALGKLLEVDEMVGGQYGFLSSKVLWKDGSLCKMNVQRDRVIVPVRNFDKRIIKIDMASFVSLLIPTERLVKFGLPIREFYIWTDDWEFTRRLSRALPCYLVPESIVIHKSALNVGADIAKDTADRLPRYRFLYRNDVVLYRGEGLFGLLYEVARLSAHCLKVLLFANGMRRKRLSTIVGGTIDGLRFRPKIEFPATGDDGD